MKHIKSVNNNSIWFKLFFIPIVAFSSVNISLAYNYGEHVDIGNKAMSLFFNQNRAFESSILREFMPFNFDGTVNTYVFSNLSIHGLPIGYGTINALSGDHVGNPLKLEEQLLTQNSYLLKIVALQNQYINTGYSAAPDGEVFKLDANYAVLALKNISHFYEYQKGLQEHIDDFRIENIENIINPALIESAFKNLNGTNAINVYITLHTAAIYLAEIAGTEAKLGNSDAKKYLYYSFLYNGFADHFLEDAFSAGHLLVNRTVFSSLVNNMPIHNFYCKYGTEVVNLNGEQWKEYGDGYYNQYHDRYNQANDLLNINYPTETDETKRIINAVYISISELKAGFEKGYQKNTNLQHFMKEIPTEPNAKTAFFIANYKALSLIPLPYNTQLKSVMPENLARNKSIEDANKPPYYRNFIRSRIANSFLMAGNSSASSSYSSIEARLNIGSLGNNYNVNKLGGKKGMIDSWYGYTISYNIGRFAEKDGRAKPQNSIIKGGIRGNYDFWVNDRRFIGLYVYNEMGLQHRDGNYSYVYVPQIGMQLGSLFNINYYNMPLILRIPAQLLLPLKFHVGYIISSKNTPVFYNGMEVDFIF
ncbi:MAG TPA: hypothetical protein VJ602_12445 [Paludibacter sp.]|nr:hypothetical protein [Paludibacter sp.]